MASKLQRRVNAFRCRGVGAAEELWSDRSFLLAAARRNPDALLQVDEAPQIPQTPAPECSGLAARAESAVAGNQGGLELHAGRSR